MPALAEESTQQLEALLSRLDRLHSSPAVALQVMEVTRDPEYDIADVKKCLENDPALTAAVLRLVNSSYYSIQRKITAVEEAMAYLGRRSLRLAVLGFGLVKSMSTGCNKEFHDAYWRRSLSMAVAARKLADRCSRKEVHTDSAFAAGLLADLGMMVLAQLDTEEYLKLCLGRDHPVSQLNEEMRHYGFTHVDVSTHLLGKWHLPEELVTAISQHHRCPADAGKLGQVLKAAGLLAEVLWTSNSPHMLLLLPLLRTRFDLGVDDLITLANECKVAVQESVEIFQVRIEGEIDVDTLQHEAQTLYAEVVMQNAVNLDSLELMIGDFIEEQG